MDYSQDFRKPPPGFIPNYTPNVQPPLLGVRPPLNIPPPQRPPLNIPPPHRAPTPNLYPDPISFAVPPPNFTQNAPPNFTQSAPPPNFTSATPPPSFAHTTTPLLPMPPPSPFSLPPPRFTAPPPSWSSAPPPTFPPQTTNHYSGATGNYCNVGHYFNGQAPAPPQAHPPPPLSNEMFRFPMPPPQRNDMNVSGKSSDYRSTSSSASVQTQNNHQSISRYNNNVNNTNNRSHRSSSIESAGSHSSSRSSSSKDHSKSHSSTVSTRDRHSRTYRDSDKESNKDRRSHTSSRRSERNSRSSSRSDRKSDRYERSSDRSDKRSSNSSTSTNKRDTSDRLNSITDSKSLGGGQEGDSSERDKLLSKWRSNYCEHFEDIRRKLTEMDPTTGVECWIRSSPSDIYYERTSASTVVATTRLDALCTLFDTELVQRGPNVRAKQEPYEPPQRRKKYRVCRHKSEQCSSSDSSDDEFNVDEDDCSMEELTKKIQHPHRLHPDLWHNETGEMNDGPFCKCSAKSRRSGIRHNIFPDETRYEKCKPNSNNFSALYHYRITISPPTNFLTKTPTIIKHDQHEFIFEGFSMFSHSPLGTLPTCKVIRFNIEYTILYIEEKMPENFTIRELDLFYNYLFIELLELLDLNLKPGRNADECCPCFHFLPRFVRDLDDNGKEVLAMAEVLRYLLDNSGPLIPRSTLEDMMDIGQSDWQNYVDGIKDMVVTNPGKKPCSIRVDQLDRNVADLPECVDPDNPHIVHPVIVHFGIRPPQLSYAGNLDYQKAWRDYVKFRHLVANMSKPSYEDKRKLENKEAKMQELRLQSRIKRNVTVAISSKDFYRTGIMCDIVQHAMLIPVLLTHLRFHCSLNVLEKSISYQFQNRYILQLALTHPSYKENFGTNPDHARNSLTNCGIRQPEYGDRKIHYMNSRKRGINTLINIMSRFGKEDETDSNIGHNERLEFLGDAVVEFLTSIHLFFMFPELEEGGLATYRAAIVENQHLAVLAKKFRLEEFMLYAHGSDLCHELELRHAMANCFEALMGALLLDGGIKVADRVFSLALFKDETELKRTWEDLPPHPLQEQEPLGDRQWIDSYQMLQELVKFEQSIGINFRHIRLLARAFTDRSIGYTHLTLGSNQRMEFLGDTVLQFICSEYLYRHFPEHHEGHLSLLRSSLVNNKTQAVVCDDLGMTKYAVYSSSKPELKTKDRADLLEAFLGALYVDRGLEPCEVFCQVCLFPRLQTFIMNQDWNDPKSKLQQCCLTLRTMNGEEPDIPLYKVIECMGPTNTRVYTVAVYFRGKRLASSTGHSIQQAEMNAAKAALDNSKGQFPQLDHQKRVIARQIERQKGKDYRGPGGRNTATLSHKENNRSKQRGTSQDQRRSLLKEKTHKDDCNLPKQYRKRDADSSDETKCDSDDSLVYSTKDTKYKSNDSSSSSITVDDSSSSESDESSVNVKRPLSQTSSRSSSRASRSSPRSPKAKKHKSNKTKKESSICSSRNNNSPNETVPNINETYALNNKEPNQSNRNQQPRGDNSENSKFAKTKLCNKHNTERPNQTNSINVGSNLFQITTLDTSNNSTNLNESSASPNHQYVQPPVIDKPTEENDILPTTNTQIDPKEVGDSQLSRILSCSSLSSSDDESLAFLEAQQAELEALVDDDTLYLSSDIDSVESGEIIN